MEMSNPYIGEIRLCGFSFAPVGWAFCNGQLLSISQYQALFALIGTTYGGDGVSTFGLPNLQSRVPIHQGTGAGLSTYLIGQTGGSEGVTLNTQQMAQHNHLANVSTAFGTTGSPANGILGTTNSGSAPSPTAGNLDFISSASNATLANNALGPAGGSQAHTNIQPGLVVNFVISLFGIFPSQG
jgi:microcystin-dependent protein